MSVPTADQLRLSRLLSDDLQLRINWAYNLEQEIATLSGGGLTSWGLASQATYVNNGDPNGVVTAVSKGDFCLDVANYALWIANGAGTVWTQAAGGGGGAPTGAAGGDLGGTYPNPTVPALTEIETDITALEATVAGPATIPESAITNLTADLAAKASATLAVGGDLTGNLPNPTLATAGPGATGPLGTASRIPIVTIDAKGRVTGLSDVAALLAATGDATGNLPGALTLKNTGPGATGPLGTALRVPVVTIDAQGRTTALTDIAIALGATGDATGTLPGALTLKNTGPGATGPSGSATVVPVVTIDAQGRVTALTTATIAIPESAVTNLTTDLAAKAPIASPTFTGTVTLPADPASALQAATMQYVDAKVAGLGDKPAVAYASTSALPANTYNNGTAGVGATLTGNANGPLLIDGVTILVSQVGERVLVAGEAAQANNGWYTITQQGVVAVSPYILTRATESDQAAEIGAGYLTAVNAPNTVTPGSANNGKVFISVAADPFTVGTTALTFSQVGGTYTNGNGIALSGSTFSIDTAVTVDKTTAQTLTNKTLTSPVLNTGVSGTAVDTDATMAANSDTLLASQKATKTALALKAPLASPALTGTPTTPTAVVGTNTTQAASTAFVRASHSGVWYAADYSIVLDGVTDCGATLNTVITNASTAGVSAIVMPEGTNPMLTSIPIVLQKGVHLYGNVEPTSSQTGIQLTAAANCDIVQLGTGCYYAGLHNIWLAGNKANQTGGDFHHGINASLNNTGLDIACIFENVRISGCTGHGYYGANSSANRLIACRVNNNNGFGIWASYDTQMVGCHASSNKLSGFFCSRVSNQIVGGKSYLNGQAPYWDGTAPAYANGAYVVGNGAISSNGSVYVCMEALTAAADPSTDANHWVRLTQLQGFVKSAAYYLVTAANITGTFAASSAQYVAVDSGLTTAFPTSVLSQGAGYHFYGTSSTGFESLGIALDAQQNSGAGIYLQGCQGIVISGTVAQPNMNMVTAANRATNTLNWGAVVLDGCSGCDVQVTSVIAGISQTQNDSATPNRTSGASSIAYFANSPTRCNVRLTDDGSGIAPTATTVGAGNHVLYNGALIGPVVGTSFVEGYTSTATAAGTTTLVAASNEQQVFTGSTTQTVALPVASTMIVGQRFRITNLSSGVVTVQSSGANTVQALAASTAVVVTCILASGTNAASWSVLYVPVDVVASLALKAPLASPTFTGTVVVPVGVGTTEAAQLSQVPQSGYFRPTGSIAATMPRMQAQGALSVLTSGTLYMVGIDLIAGQVIATISMKSGGTAASVPTNQWAGIGLITAGVPGVVQRLSTDLTTTAWGTFTVQTFTLTSTYTIPTNGSYYILIMVKATTVPNIIGNSGASTNILNVAPIGAGATTDTGLSTPPGLPFTPGAITTSGNVPYVWLS